MGGVRRLVAHLAERRTSGRTATPTTILADASVVLTEALKEGTGRFDASDLMPSAVGTGSFWTGMVEYVQGGPDSLDGVLSDIEASWPEP